MDRHGVCFHAHADDLALAVTRHQVSLVVWEASPAIASECETLAAVGQWASDVRVIVLLDLTRVAARQVVTLTRHLPHVVVLVRDHDDLAHQIAAAQHQSAPSAHLAITRYLLPSIPERAADIVAAAALSGHRRTSIPDFARVCGVPTRTLEWRLRTAGVAPARNVLGWMNALHSLWRLERLGWTSKQTAAAGFSSCEAWSNYLARHAGARPTALLHDGFTQLLTRCGEQVRGARDGRRT
jgi:hypothetical protein